MESVIGWDGVYGTVALLYLFGPLLIVRVAAWDVWRSAVPLTGNITLSPIQKHDSEQPDRLEIV